MTQRIIHPLRRRVSYLRDAARIAFFFWVWMVGQYYLAAQESEPVYKGKPESYWILLLRDLKKADLFSQLGSNQVTILLKAVECQGPGASAIRTNAAEILNMMDDPNILMPIAKSNLDVRVRCIAISGLARHLEKQITDIMIQALKDPNPEMRKAGVEGFGLTAREKTSVDGLLLAKLLADKDSEIRAGAAQILAISYNRMDDVMAGAMPLDLWHKAAV